MQELPHLSHLGVRARQVSLLPFFLSFLDCINSNSSIIKLHKMYVFVLQEKVVFVTCEDEEKVADFKNLNGKFVRLRFGHLSLLTSTGSPNKNFLDLLLFRLEASSAGVSLTQTSTKSSNGKARPENQSTLSSSKVETSEENSTSSISLKTSDVNQV